MQFIRTAWGDFPKVKVLYPLNTLKRASEELYYKAKGGDVIAAYELLFEYVIKQQDIDDFGLMVLNQNPILVPVLAQEHLGKNRIPAVFAEIHSDQQTSFFNFLWYFFWIYHVFLCSELFYGSDFSGSDYFISVVYT